MAKYHVNPDTGIPGICNANTAKCPYGGEDVHGSTPAEAVTRLEKRLAKDARALKGLKKSVDAATPLVEAQPGSLTYHDQKAARVAEAVAGPSAQKPTAYWYSIRAGEQVNPATGDGEVYGHYAHGVVIVGKKDGSRIRMIAGGTPFSGGKNILGQRLTLSKQQSSGRDGETRDLVVLGIVDENGDKAGYIPNKKIQYFVLK